MGIYSERAVNNFKSGYNCAQSVFLAFAEDLGFDKETALKLTSSFGGGMGRLREVCGAVSSMFMAAGILRGYTSCNDDIAKENHYRLVQELAHKFKALHKTIICRELLGLDIDEDSPVPSKRTEAYYAERPCESFIRTAAEIIEESLLNKRDKSLVVKVNSDKN